MIMELPVQCWTADAYRKKNTLLFFFFAMNCGLPGGSRGK